MMTSLPVEPRTFITTEQLREANSESSRLGFSRILNLPKKLPNFKLPVTLAWIHRSREGRRNVRLAVLYTTRRDASDGTTVYFDVTNHFWKTIRRQQA